MCILDLLSLWFDLSGHVTVFHDALNEFQHAGARFTDGLHFLR